jgi:hypothetical protein
MCDVSVCVVCVCVCVCVVCVSVVCLCMFVYMCGVCVWCLCVCLLSICSPVYCYSLYSTNEVLIVPPFLVSISDLFSWITVISAGFLVRPKLMDLLNLLLRRV